MSHKILRLSTINPRVRDIEYAVRGKVVMRADEVQRRMAEDPKYCSSLPFKRVVFCNIGNPQSLKQKPLTFLRQVVALVEYPELIEKAPKELFPEDARERARKYLDAFGSLGAYTHSQGNPTVREEIAEFIHRRDGYPANPNDIFITGGASPGVQQILNLMIRSPSDGVMIPIPQYPLYSASIPLLGGLSVPYYLDEGQSWGLRVEQLERSLAEARARNTEVRALVVINPGNPTGAVLSEQNIRDVIDFCWREKLVIMADEVYQENIYTDKKFHSFKKVLRSMGDKYQNQELVSFHSMSKGLFGECGHRGGYYELVGFEKEIHEVCYKRASVNLCSNSVGQMMLGLMANPPREGSDSYALYSQERAAVLGSLTRRAALLTKSLNTLEGVSLEQPPGAMYAFPKIQLSRKAVETAKQQGLAPDAFYAIRALESSGIVIVPGSGFGQQEGTYHFRTTFLPPENEFEEVMKLFCDFHTKFINEFRD